MDLARCVPSREPDAPARAPSLARRAHGTLLAARRLPFLRRSVQLQRLFIRVEDLNASSLVGDIPPEHQTGRAAGFHDTPLPADADDAAGEVILAERFARGNLRYIMRGIELAAG